MPLLPRLVLGMPLILIVPVVGMSQITSTQILGLTKPNYNAPRISPSRYETSHRSLQIKSYCTSSSIVTLLSLLPTSKQMTKFFFKPNVDNHGLETEGDDGNHNDEEIVELALKNPAKFAQVMATEVSFVTSVNTLSLFWTICTAAYVAGFEKCRPILQHWLPDRVWTILALLAVGVATLLWTPPLLHLSQLHCWHLSPL